MTRRSQICPGSGLDAGILGRPRLQLSCPVCGVAVAIGLQNRFVTHGTTKGRGGRKPKIVGGATATKWGAAEPSKE